ncbi:MAG: hypothetical protein OXF44_13185 [Anaerolineaceae bacterium]|nr:hypothetical protein [Anaerolineaceae bacterium]
MSQPQTVTTESLPPEWQHLATKADLAEIHGEVAELRSNVVELRTRVEFMATMEDLAKLRGEFSESRTGLFGLRVSLGTAGWFPGLAVGLEIALVVALVQIGLFFLLRSLG